MDYTDKTRKTQGDTLKSLKQFQKQTKFNGQLHKSKYIKIKNKEVNPSVIWQFRLVTNTPFPEKKCT